MKTLNILFVTLFTSFFVTQSFADIHFTFKHNPSSANADLPSSMLPTLYIGAQKENGAHLAQSESRQNQRNEMHPGESSEDSVFSSLFAPDPAGVYIIHINCYGKLWAMASKGFITTKISDLKDGSTVSIEAACPITNENGKYYVGPPQNVVIKVDGNYIMGAPIQ